MNPNQKLIDSLQEFTDYLSLHKELPILSCSLSCVAPVTDAEELADMARKHGPVDKDAFGSWFAIRKNFGKDIRLTFFIERELVCKKIVRKETVTVPASPAREAMPEQTYEKEVVEWECPKSILNQE